MFESVESQAIFSWILSIVIMGLVLWYALGFFQKQAAGITPKEALAERTPNCNRLGVIATLAAAASYYFDASDALETLFIALPIVLLVPAQFLHDQATVFFYFAVVGELLAAMSYARILVDPKTKESLNPLALTDLIFVSSILPLLFAVLWISPESLGVQRPNNLLGADHLGFFSFLVLVMLVNPIYDHRKTALMKPVVQKCILLLYVLLITYAAVSFVALQVLSSTEALIVLVILAMSQTSKIEWLTKRLP